MIAIISLIVAILSLIISLIVYIVHERKLFKQQEKLNELNIKIAESIIDERKKAIIHIEKGFINSIKTINCINRGESTARNFEIELDTTLFLLNAEEITKFDLLPNAKLELKYIPTESTPDQITITCKWDDDYSRGRTLSMRIHT